MAYERTLRAGALQATFRDGELWHVRSGAAEVIERIYAAVRDRNWGTPAGRLANLKVQERDGEFQVEFDSVHQQAELDFRWHGTIVGSADGRLSFTMDGKAHSTFLRNRIGLCVHHPLRACAGQPCTVETSDGKRTASRFPEFVAPHQPFVNMRAIAYEVAGVRAEVRFTGDIFETEDHRNWTDANFKTYSTPLHLPFPVEVAAGTEVRQRVEVVLQGASTAAEPSGVVRVKASGEPRALPRIGLGMASDGRGLEESERRALRRLRIAHLRLDAPADGDSRNFVERAAREAESLGAKLEIALTLPREMATLRDYRPARWLVYDEKLKSSDAAAARFVRDVVGDSAPIVIGTNAYFAELNRNRPRGDGWDGACFSVNPQVHAFDDESVMLNAAAQYDAVRSAREFVGSRGVVVSPVTLRPRFNPDATDATGPQQQDPRQKQQICAAWTVASLRALAEAGASSVTYFETSGAGGLVEGSERFPVYAVFEAIAGFDRFAACEVSDPSRVAALGLGRRILLANLTPRDCEVRVEGWRPVVLGPYEVRTTA